MIKFSKEKVLLLHQIMAEATGGSVGVRDESLLDSALEGAFAGFGDQEFYPSKEEKGGLVIRLFQTMLLLTVTNESAYISCCLSWK